MKKLLSILLAAVMVLSLASCGGGAASGNAPTGSGSGAAEPTGDTVKVGVLVPLPTMEMCSFRAFSCVQTM